MAQEWLNSANYGTVFAGLQIVAFLGSMRWFVSLRKRYDEETVKGWLVPHTGIKGIPGVVGTGVAWCVISSLVYIISPYLSLEQESYKSLTPTGGKDYFVFVLLLQFVFFAVCISAETVIGSPAFVVSYMGYDVRNVRKGNAE